jgi:C-terminal processing protease CtpA/Prc
LQVTVTRHTYPDGIDLPVDGIEPDIEVGESPRALRDGTDPALDRAREEVAEQIRRRR